MDETARLCFEIEGSLSEIEFLGVPLGATLGDTLSSVFCRRTVSPGIVRFAIAAVVREAHRWRSAEPAPANYRRKNTPLGRVLLANISTRSHHRHSTPRLADALGPENCNVLSDDIDLQQHLPEKTGMISWSEAPSLDVSGWRRACGARQKAWRRTIQSLRRRFGFSATAAALLDDAMLVATQRITRYGALLDQLRPEAVLIEYDRNARGSCLVLAARCRGIPSLTLVHGVINGPFGYNPVLANTVLCWGEIQRRQFINYGTESDRIEIVGFDRMDEELQADQIEVRSGLGVAQDATVALLATNPIELAARECFSRSFCEAVSQSPGILGLVRLHPSESLDAYKEVALSFPHVRFTANDELKPDEAIAAADVVVAHSSGFGGEALAKGRLAVVLDTLDSPIGHGEDLIRFGDVPRARSGEELSGILIRIRSDAGFREALRQSGEVYTKSMFAAFGEEACNNIAAAVRSRSGCSDPGWARPPAQP